MCVCLRQTGVIFLLIVNLHFHFMVTTDNDFLQLKKEDYNIRQIYSCLLRSKLSCMQNLLAIYTHVFLCNPQFYLI